MAKKAYSPDPKAETIKRIQRTEAYAEKVRQLFAATVNEILALNKSVPTLDEGVMYSFDGDNMRIQKESRGIAPATAFDDYDSYQKGDHARMGKGQRRMR